MGAHPRTARPVTGPPPCPAEPGPARGEQTELLAALRSVHHRLLCEADRTDPVWEASLCLSESLMSLVTIAVERDPDGGPAHRAAMAHQVRAAVRAADVATRFPLTDPHRP